MRGSGAYVTKGTNQTITGNKTFSGTISLGSSATATTQSSGSNSTSVATTAYVDSLLGTATSIESIQDIVGAMVSSNNESGISATYDDTNGKLDFDVNDPTITITGDVDGSATMTNLGNTTINVTLDTVNSNTGSFGSTTEIPVVTVNAKGLVTAVSTASISTTLTVGADTGTADSVALSTDTLQFTGGEGIDTAVTNNTITISAEDATTTNKGVASFANNDFNISSGAVSIKNVNLATQTTGDYVASLVAGTGVTLSNNSGENSTPTIAIGQSVETNATVTFATVTTTGNTSIGGSLTITGDLTVNGNTTTLNTSTLVVEDKNIVLSNTSSPTDTTADGAGITVLGATNKTFNWLDSTDSWTSSENIDILSGKIYSINGTTVLSNNTLGSGVVTSSLTSVGTISTGTWQAGTIAISYGGTGATTASQARTNLGLAIGTDVQAYDAELAALAGLTSAADKLPYFTGSETASLATFTNYARTLLDDADASTARTTLGLGTIAVQNANSVSITGGSITNLTTFDGVTIDGGTF